MWTSEQKMQASIRAKARWADPEYRVSQGDSIKKAPCCPTCGEKDIAKFYTDADGGRTNRYCRECHKQACKARWHSRDALERWASRNYKYGVTKDFLLDLYSKQDGKCAVCGQVPTTTRGLHIDHCHATGKVRGLLCHGCNVALGNFKDSRELLQKAIEYLQHS